MNVKMLLWTTLANISILTSHYGWGFGGLDDVNKQFTQPKPNPNFEFPKDHGPHPNYRIEWWYLTANLNDADGKNWSSMDVVSYCHSTA